MAFPDRLRDLARAHGLQPDYRDIGGKTVRCSPESLLATLRALGCDIASAAGAGEALRRRRLANWRRAVEPVSVAWDDAPPVLDVRLPASAARGRARCDLDLESGERRSWEIDLAAAPVVRSARVEGEAFERRRITAPGAVPHGYHRWTVQLGDTEHVAQAIAAPRRAFHDGARAWGVFLPLHALETAASWGAGDFGDLRRLLDWAAGRGAGTVGVLPLLATFLDECYEPSPYSPVSRLFWNEFYVDVTRVPELEHCEAGRAMLENGAVTAALQRLRSERLVDYAAGMRCKRAVLQELARFFHSYPSPARHAAFERFRATHPDLDAYARFRATSETQRRPWSEWPAAARDGRLAASDYDPEAARYHAYVQWVADEQLDGAAQQARERGTGLYLDFPLGVHASGFDTWRHRDAFALGVRVGAPPDVFFSSGQDWGFPPPHPAAMRRDGHAYVRACLRHHLQYASHLRLDHIMGLHRLYWIPPGCDARNGVYVRYPFEETYAVLALESHRTGAMLIGENLGTVPAAVQRSMREHGMLGMHVLQYELPAGEAPALAQVRAESAASLNTHDMRPFAGFWQGLDIDDRIALGVLSEEAAVVDRQERAALRRRLAAWLRAAGLLDRDDAGVREVIRACLVHLAASPAALVLVNLEDLWAETAAQNVPSTSIEMPNWRRKARYRFEEVSELREVDQVLRAVARHRGRAGVRS